MKIAILTPTFNHFSGIDRVVQLQAEDYARKGNKVSVIALEAKIKTKKYDVIALGMPKSPFWQRLYRLFFFLDSRKISYCKKLRDYDLVISHFYPMNWLACSAKKKYGIRYAYWDHGINTMGLLNSIPQKIYMKLFEILNNITLRNIDEAYSVSKYLSTVLYKESGIKSKVVYNKIDSKRFNKQVNGSRITKKRGLKNKKVLLYVGRIAPHKGIHYLIGALKSVKKDIPNAKLLIVGKPTFKRYYNKLKKKSSEDVLFTGFVADKSLPEYYAACDVYVTCSQWEGFNLPAVEAQACGKPVVAFNIGSHPEVVKRGKLVKNMDLLAFSRAVIGYLKK